jgi:ubiquinone/menaquinone biosynthesis C-methylase UbiE
MRVMFGDERAAARADALVAWLVEDLEAAGFSQAHVLDVPCGGGAELLGLAPRASVVVGLDLSPSMLGRAASKLAGVPHAHLVHGDALAMPFAASSFQGALSVNGLHVMPDPAAFLSELRRVLVPGGALALSTLVQTDTFRQRAIVDVLGRRALRVLPRELPTLDGVLELLDGAGFDVRQRDGQALVALRCVAR